MRKRYNWFTYLLIYSPLLAMGFYLPIQILKGYGPNNIEYFWSSFNSYNIYEIAQFFFILLVSLILILFFAMMLMTIAQELENRRSGLWIGFIGLGLSFYIFFSYQNVGVNLDTIVFFLTFNLFSYSSFFKLIDSK